MLAASRPCVRGDDCVGLTDADGVRRSDAVVTLTPASAARRHVARADHAIIDQRHQMFLPLVVVVRRGGRVVFTNNDDTMHQVYSVLADQAVRVRDRERPSLARR